MSSWFKRSLTGLAAVVLVSGLAACGSAPFGGDGPGRGGRGGPDGEGPRMGMMGRHGHDEGHGPRSEADMQKMRERMVERVSAQLELDAAQKGRLVKMFEAMDAQRSAMAGNPPPKAGEPGQPGGRPGHGGPGLLPPQQMQELIKGERFDRARAQALVDEKAQAARAAAPQVIAAMADFYDSLKPEQQIKVRTFLERGPGGRRGMDGDRRHG
ncbi:MAG: periplasmic protein CpxP/Spy [Pseudomonadota bacterium]|nr:periplasmic protein CpxP/Spy [Pseudomonadota bacterium]